MTKQRLCIASIVLALLLLGSCDNNSGGGGQSLGGNQIANSETGVASIEGVWEGTIGCQYGATQLRLSIGPISADGSFSAMAFWRYESPNLFVAVQLPGICQVTDPTHPCEFTCTFMATTDQGATSVTFTSFYNPFLLEGSFTTDKIGLNGSWSVAPQS